MTKILCHVAFGRHAKFTMFYTEFCRKWKSHGWDVREGTECCTSWCCIWYRTVHSFSCQPILFKMNLNVENSIPPLDGSTISWSFDWCMACSHFIFLAWNEIIIRQVFSCICRWVNEWGLFSQSFSGVRSLHIDVWSLKATVVSHISHVWFNLGIHNSIVEFI